MNFSTVSSDKNDRFILVKRSTNEIFRASRNDALFFDTRATANRFIADGTDRPLTDYDAVEVGTPEARLAFNVTFGRVKKSQRGYNRRKLEQAIKPLGLVLYPVPH